MGTLLTLLPAFYVRYFFIPDPGIFFSKTAKRFK